MCYFSKKSFEGEIPRSNMGRFGHFWGGALKLAPIHLVAKLLPNTAPLSRVNLPPSPCFAAKNLKKNRYGVYCVQLFCLCMAGSHLRAYYTFQCSEFILCGRCVELRFTLVGLECSYLDVDKLALLVTSRWGLFFSQKLGENWVEIPVRATNDGFVKEKMESGAVVIILSLIQVIRTEAGHVCI